MEKNNTTKIIGYILITPALISVLLFIIQLITEASTLSTMEKGAGWTGDMNGDGGGYTSALPFYFGLMAIAGAYLIKDKK